VNSILHNRQPRLIRSTTVILAGAIMVLAALFALNTANGSAVPVLAAGPVQSSIETLALTSDPTVVPSLPQVSVRSQTPQS
jgi:hypothetical protein